MASETGLNGTTVALTLNAFTYTGYTFNDWNSEANGSGTAFSNGERVEFEGSETLYAQWIAGPSTSTVIFNANGGSGAMPNESESAATALTLNKFTRTDYTFDDWSTSANGTGTDYSDGATYAFVDSVTLYAQWTEVPTITFTGSQNWSGYVLPSSTTIFTDVSGDWTVPTLNCSDTPNANSSTWVGIGGAGGSSGVLLQTGTDDQCTNGEQQDTGWFEEYPSDPNYAENYEDFPVSPGDEMNASVYENSDGAWVTVLNNLTTGLTGIMVTGEGWGVAPTPASGPIEFTYQGTTTDLSYSGGYSAEWIVEDPTAAATNAFAPFADFESVTFTDVAVSLPSGWTLPDSDGYEIVQGGVVLAVPSVVSADGGFTVTYQGP